MDLTPLGSQTTNKLPPAKRELPREIVSVRTVIDILLVDDRTENLVALEAVLQSPDYNLIKAESGDEALRYLLDHEPALILLDVQMPGLDGYETASIIKRSERTREIPIIFITALNQDERYIQKGYAYGAVDYIYKPYNAHILKSKVEVFADLSRKTKRLLQAEKLLRENELKERERQIARLEMRSMRREQADQKKYRELVDGIHHGIVWVADVESLAVSFVSPSAERILGYTPDQWMTETGFLLKHLHPAELEKFLDGVRTAQTEQKDARFEHRFFAANGREVWLHSGIRMARKDNGDGFEMRGLSIDITKNKEAETLLVQNKARSDFLSDASRILSESLDYELGLEKLGELVIPRMAEFYSVEILNDHGPPKSIAMGNKETPGKTVLSLSVRGKILGTLTVTAHAEAPYSAADLEMFRDLGHRISSTIDNSNLYKQAQAAVRARDEFLSIASHELKTPLTPLKIQTQSLMRMISKTSLAELEPTKVNKLLSTSDRQLSKLAQLIDDLLDVSRISMGRLEIKTEAFDLTELLQEVVERFCGSGGSAKYEVNLNIQNTIPVKWDRFRMEQVVINLLTNAIKYGANKPIEIEATGNHETVQLIFRDHGIGIAKEDQKRIFARFERAVPSANIAGLGLGLYIVSQILDAHGGTIKVESEIGKGACFLVNIPSGLNS